MIDLELLALLTIVVIAIVQDLCYMKISNWLIVIGLSIGMTSRIERAGWRSFVPGMWNILIPVLLLYLLFRMRVLGAGDIKLFSVIGSFLSLEQLMKCIIYSFLIGATISVVLLLANKNFWKSICRAGDYFIRLSQGERLTYDEMGVEKKNYMHFAVAIGLGLLVAL